MWLLLYVWNEATCSTMEKETEIDGDTGISFLAHEVTMQTDMIFRAKLQKCTLQGNISSLMYNSLSSQNYDVFMYVFYIPWVCGKSSRETRLVSSGDEVTCS